MLNRKDEKLGNFVLTFSILSYFPLVILGALISITLSFLRIYSKNTLDSKLKRKLKKKRE